MLAVVSLTAVVTVAFPGISRESNPYIEAALHNNNTIAFI